MHRILTAVISATMLAALTLVAAGCGDKQRQEMPAAGGEDISPRYTEDIRMYEQALSSNPNNLDILIQLGNKYYDWGEEEVHTEGDRAEPVPKWLKAIDYYNRALEIDPKNADVRTDMGNLLNWMGRFDEAEEAYRTAIKSNPNHPQSRINLVTLLGGRMGRYKEAIKEYETLLKVSPEQKDNTSLKEEVDDYRAKMKEAGR